VRRAVGLIEKSIFGVVVCGGGNFGLEWELC
jgi:hypothetical protein